MTSKTGRLQQCFWERSSERDFQVTKYCIFFLSLQVTGSETIHLLSLNSICCCHHWKDNSAVDVPLVSHIGDILYSCPSWKKNPNKQNTMPCSLSGGKYLLFSFSHTSMQNLPNIYIPSFYSCSCRNYTEYYLLFWNYSSYFIFSWQIPLVIKKDDKKTYSRYF